MDISKQLEIFETTQRVKTVGQLIDVLKDLPQNTAVETICCNSRREGDWIVLDGSYEIAYKI